LFQVLVFGLGLGDTEAPLGMVTKWTLCIEVSWLTHVIVVPGETVMLAG